MSRLGRSRRSATRASAAQPRSACDELGLRAIVYLEVFGERRPGGIAERFERAPRARSRTSLGDRVSLGVSPHAAYSVSTPSCYASCPRARPAGRRLTSRRATARSSGCLAATGAMARIAELCCVAPPGDGPASALLAADGPARARDDRSALRDGRRRGDRAARRARRRRRPLPALERASRLRRRAARRAARRRRAGRARHRQPGLDAARSTCSRRCGRRSPWPARRAADPATLCRERRPRARDSRVGARARPRRTRSDRSTPGSAPT